MIATRIKNAMRTAYHTLSHRRHSAVLKQLKENDPRWQTFSHAVDYIRWEGVPGDILEFGVYGGQSLVLLGHAHFSYTKGIERCVAGFDSFNGLPESRFQHANWNKGAFAVNHWQHPLLKTGEPVTPEVVRELARTCGIPSVNIHAGLFDETIPMVVPSQYSQIALLHIDCDIYESTASVLNAVAPALSDGCVVLFDDWFLYKGNPDQGEQLAWREFLETHPEWRAVHYRAYGTCCNSFILSRG